MNDSDIPRILDECRTIAVVGWSTNPERPNHWIASYLEEQGYRVFRVNPAAAEAEAEAMVAVWPSLAAIEEPIDLVDVFRAPPHVPAVVAEAAAVGAKVVWMQPGAENAAAVTAARNAGMLVVSGRCIYAEHRARHGAR